MSPRWLIGMALAFLILGVFANITDGFFLEDKNVMPIWSALENFQNVNILNPMTYDSVFIGVGDVITAVWDMFTWNYSFLNDYKDPVTGVVTENPYQFFRWILISISVGIFVEFMFGIFRLVRGSG